VIQNQFLTIRSTPPQRSPFAPRRSSKLETYRPLKWLRCFKRECEFEERMRPRQIAEWDLEEIK
jgi:hypothetical protein